MDFLLAISLGSYTSQVYFIESILFLFFLFQILYLLIFTLGSLSKSRDIYPKADENARFAVIIATYALDQVLLDTIQSLRAQDYPAELVDFFVVGNTENKALANALSLQHVTLISASQLSELKRTKKAMLAIQQTKIAYDMVLLIDAGNQFDTDYLTKLNNAFYSGCYAIQSHRLIKHTTSDAQYLSAISEEINNAIFRRGHTSLGFSSALLNSGMAVDFDLFGQFIDQAHGQMLSKQLERFLLYRNVYIEYLEEAFVYDCATKVKKELYQKRTRWFGNRVYNLFIGFSRLTSAILNKQMDYCNKLIQWMLPSRIILVVLVFFLALFFSTTFFVLAIKWWALFFLLLVIFCLAIPNYLVSNRLLHLMLTLPFLFIFSILNLISQPFRRAKKEQQ